MLKTNVKKQEIMTEQENKRRRKLEQSLTYGRGIFTSEWVELKELRTKWLTEQGEDPSKFDLGSRNLKRK